MPTDEKNRPDNRLNNHTTAEIIAALARKKAAKIPVPCRECGKDFVRNREWQEFCTVGCKMGWHNRKRETLVAALLARIDELEKENIELRKALP
jgi:hypothetical protein